MKKWKQSAMCSAHTQDLKSAHRQAIAGLVAQFEAHRPSTHTVGGFLSQITQTTDQTLADLWRASQMPADAALVAMGGYGRAELFPYSDMDVLILLPDGMVLEQNKKASAAVELFIQRSWDIGLHIGSSVRTLAQSLDEAQGDITIQTAQLESRLVTGNSAIFTQFQQQFMQKMNPQTFIQEKLREMRYRHLKYEDTPYALEPNCKEGPGGLRDLQVILWITKAARLGCDWAELEKNGLITKLEERQLQDNEAWLKLVRAHLHLLTQRHEDRLVFDVQEQIALRLGYQADRERRASEVFMRRYYRTAKAVSQINQIMVLSIVERAPQKHDVQVRPINADFVDKAGTLDIVDDGIYLKEPRQILRTFLVYVQQPGIKTFSARTFRALYNARRQMNASFRKDPVNAQTFMAILQSPQGITHAFRLMNQTSVLGRYLWAFRSIVGQMQHDLFHVYTVDQHTLMVLRNMRRFFLPEHAHEYPLCSEIAADFDKPWLLYIATLFHDIAKGRGGDHSELGAQEVVAFAHAHNISEEDTHFLAFLVAQHLTMSHVAQKEDTGDAQVIKAFVKKVGDERHLNALYLLTVADIRGTSPKVWNSWKAHLLEHLYKLSLHVLGGHVPESGALVATRKRMAFEILEQQGFRQGCEQPLWATLGSNYFMRHEARDIAWHTQMLWDKVAFATPLVYTRTLDNQEGIQVLVYSPDRPDLFARICGFFSMTELSIVDARIHTASPGKNQPGWALDTFQVMPDARVIEMDDSANELAVLGQQIAMRLCELLLQNAPLPEQRVSRRISRRAKYFPLPPMVSLQPDDNRERWLLSIVAGDRMGILYVIARILAKHHIDVELAKIMTLGDRIEDTFLVSSPQLANPRFQTQLENELSQALQLE